MQLSGLKNDELSIVKQCLPANVPIKLFGSRVLGTFRPHSDLDICIMSDWPKTEIAKLSTKFSASALPFSVDIFIYKDCSTDYKKLIDDTGVSLDN